MTGFSTKMRLLSTNSSYRRKKIWMQSGTTDELRYLPLPSWFPWPVCLFLASLSDSSCCSESEDSEIQICEFIPATACVLSRVFFLYSESISGLDALHTVLNSEFVHTLPKEQASPAQLILFSGVMTPALLPVRPGLHLTDVGLL